MVVVVGLAACLFGAALAAIFLQTQGSTVELEINLVIAAIFLATAVGLWRLHPLGRGAAVFLLWCAFVLDTMLLLGTFNPWYAMEHHHATGNFLTTTELALQLWPAIVALPIIGLALHLLGKYKADFRRGAQVVNTDPQ
jgi:purine-cytosine permease-like protein